MSIPTSQVNTISAMQARQTFGKLLDRSFYWRESFVVERSGEPLAAIVPLVEYQQLQRQRRQAKARAGAIMDRIRSQTADVDPSKVEQEARKALKEIRSQAPR